MVFGLLVAFATLGQAPTTPEPEWREYTAPDRAFTILMPGPVEVEDEMRATPGGSLPMRTALAKVGNSAYVVHCLDYPPEFLSGDPEDILDDAQKVALAKAK